MADWAESAALTQATGGVTHRGAAAAAQGRGDLEAAAGGPNELVALSRLGRPSIDPDAGAGKHAKNRQVRLPAARRTRPRSSWPPTSCCPTRVTDPAGQSPVSARRAPSQVCIEFTGCLTRPAAYKSPEQPKHRRQQQYRPPGRGTRRPPARHLGHTYLTTNRKGTLLQGERPIQAQRPTLTNIRHIEVRLFHPGSAAAGRTADTYLRMD